MDDAPSQDPNARRGIAVFNVPVAIVVAGALIAIAIYFSRGGADEGKRTLEEDIPDTEPSVTDIAQGPTADSIRPVTDKDHVLGARDAKVTVVEYSDLECPFCKSFHPTAKKIIDEYPNEIRLVYRHFPLDALHSKARTEAQATECAGEQGKFWEYVDKVFEVTPSNNGLDLKELPQIARDVGITDISKFEACLESKKYAQKVADDLADAEAAGGQGTPYSVVLSESGFSAPIEGAQPYAEVKKVIDEALTK